MNIKCLAEPITRIFPLIAKERINGKINKRITETPPCPKFAVLDSNKEKANRLFVDYCNFTGGRNGDRGVVKSYLGDVHMDIFNDPYAFLRDHKSSPYNLLVCSVNLNNHRMTGWQVIELLLNNKFYSKLVILLEMAKSYSGIKNSDCIMYRPVMFSNIYKIWKDYKDRIHDNHFQVIFRKSEYENGKEF